MITVDTREQKLIEVLTSLQQPFEIQQLELGDVIISNVEGDQILIERKSLNDLEQSIKDGRYNEQKCRLKSSNKKFFYIIENYKNFKNTTAICKGALLNSSIRDQITLLYSSSIEDTATIIIEFYNRFIKDPSKYLEGGAPKSNYDESLCVFSKKGDNNSRSNVYLRQLSVIPGISYKKAKSIIEGSKTESLYELTKKIKEENYRLSSIDNIGPKIEKVICHYLV